MVVTDEELNQGSYSSKMVPGDWMLQPFLEEILDGEVSLHFFGKKFSHSIIKVPKHGDFRVQEEFGGNILPHTPDNELMEFAMKTIESAPGEAFYARVDGVKHNGKWLLMELEMVEPSLYFRTNKMAATNFREALMKI